MSDPTQPDPVLPSPQVPTAEAGGPDAAVTAGSEGYRAMRDGFAAATIDRDVVVVEGNDAATFLQGQLSADVLALAAGASTWTWVLQPGGKVEVLARITRLDADRFALDTDPGWGEALTVRLKRFALRTKVELSQPAWTVVALRGPDAQPPAIGGGIEAVADASWPGLVGYDLLGPGPAVPPEAVVLDPADLEIARVESGIVRMGAELTERTIPAETGLIERTVSFTKGCYTGQELVARIDSRGSKVARRLCGLRLSGASPGSGSGSGDILAGAGLRSDGKDVGTITSATRSPRLGPIALAYVRRAIDLGATVEVVAASDGEQPASPTGVTAVVSTLPMIP
ncbi:MAG: YgfZ/GcvT domain-containing protein [Acidimicrobiales bacterium]